MRSEWKLSTHWLVLDARTGQEGVELGLVDHAVVGQVLHVSLEVENEKRVAFGRKPGLGVGLVRPVDAQRPVLNEVSLDLVLTDRAKMKAGCLVRLLCEWLVKQGLPSSMSGGRPPTNTLREYFSLSLEGCAHGLGLELFWPKQAAFR